MSRWTAHEVSQSRVSQVLKLLLIELPLDMACLVRSVVHLAYGAVKGSRNAVFVLFLLMSSLPFHASSKGWLVADFVILDAWVLVPSHRLARAFRSGHTLRDNALDQQQV